MRFKVKEIGEDGLDIQVSVGPAWFEAECSDLDIRPGQKAITLAGRLEKAGENFLLRGDLRGDVMTPCARCLESAQVPLQVDIAVSYVEVEEGGAGDPSESDDDDGDVLPFSEGVIDLTSELRDEILLALPMGPLCRPDCAGICPVCGGNRNLAPCDCVERQKQNTSKFSPLKDIKF